MKNKVYLVRGPFEPTIERLEGEPISFIGHSCLFGKVCSERNHSTGLQHLGLNFDAVV